MSWRRIPVLGVPVDALTMREAVAAVESMIGEGIGTGIGGGRPRAVLAVNPEKVIRAQKDPALLRCLEDAGLLIPDGIGVVMAARLLARARVERVPGAELMPEVCCLAARRGAGVFLFGAGEAVNRRTAEILAARYPGLRIVGRRHGYLTDEEMPRLIEAINASGAAILFVALGSPQQERWIAAHLPALQVSVCQGVGGTFDVIAGRVRRAPWILRCVHLEWLYRLLSQPRRLLRQTALPLFAYQVFVRMVAR